jgi:MtaA/CmuA family methyltransferase
VNSYERVMKRLRSETVDRPPNFDILMTFAAHYIRQPLSRYYLDYKVLVQANLAMLKTFGVDIAQTISDPYREAADFGLDVEFPDDGLPLRREPLITDVSDLKQLKLPDPGSGRRMSDRLEAVRSLRERVGGEVPIMGWVEGALAEANALRGDTSLMLDLYDRPGWVHELLEICTEAAIKFAKAQIHAGADIIGLGDAIASQVSPAMYREFALPYEKRIFHEVHEMGALARLHICGNTSRILALIPLAGADIFDPDWMVDLRIAREKFGDEGPALCGNFDPVRVMLQSTPEKIRNTVWSCLRAGGPRCISAAGCEIPDGTPYENLMAQAQALAEYRD